MKKIIITFLLTIAPTLFFGQSIFDKYYGKDEVVATAVSKKMFEMMGNVKSNDKNAQQFLRLSKGIDKLQIFTTSDKKWSADIKSTVEKHLKSNALEELMRVSEGGENVKIYINSGGSTANVKELLMFIEDGKSETVLLSLIGNFDLNDLSVLGDKIPGGEELKKASGN